MAESPGVKTNPKRRKLMTDYIPNVLNVRKEVLLFRVESLTQLNNL